MEDACLVVGAVIRYWFVFMRNGVKVSLTVIFDKKYAMWQL